MKQRHAQLRLQQPEGTAAVRHKCMDPVKIANYFSVVQQFIDENKLSLESIWNTDETGMQLEHKWHKEAQNICTAAEVGIEKRLQ